jgi:hypothetical protein
MDRAAEPDADEPPTTAPPTPGLNRNHARRDELLGTAAQRYAGGIKTFHGLDAARLERLIAERFVDPTARVNVAPSAKIGRASCRERAS